jgi:hypothetical protein
MAVVGIALIVAALILGRDELTDLGSGENGGSEIRIASDSATDFDPFGGDGEHPEDAGLAIDGEPSTTAWTTERYTSGLAKEGVGIYVDAGKEVEVSAVEVRFAEGGSDVEIRSAPGQEEAPEELDGWELIGEASDVSTRVRIDTPETESSRFYLVWLTKLPETGGDQVAEISDIRLLE